MKTTMPSFTIYPAIDLRRGRVVRLKYGDPQQQTIFSDNPVEMAQRWLNAGAAWLHIVNLDGAFGEQRAANWEVLPALTTLGAKVQFGGGVRTLADIERALTAGVTRVILGTTAIENPAFVAQALAQFGADTIVVGLDAREGLVQTRGWRVNAGQAVHDVGQQMAALGVKTIIHTDIGRDGVLTGVNWSASQALAQATGLPVIASGGVASMDDITACHQAEGLAGVITGRAIYDGRLNLEEAFQSLADKD